MLEVGGVVAKAQKAFCEAGYQWEENIFNDGCDECMVKFTKSQDPTALSRYPEPDDTVGWGRFPRDQAWSMALEWLQKQQRQAG